MEGFYEILLHIFNPEAEICYKLLQKIVKDGYLSYLEYCVYIIFRCAASKWKFGLFQCFDSNINLLFMLIVCIARPSGSALWSNDVVIENSMPLQSTTPHPGFLDL